ncbi:hypothetical protein SEPCBS119000_003849 [Sporothrix epigloea]|uniref:Rrn9 domain-containing protein n=1 Tax=Sporothrix epigloea TaxID=1892477 RepID=A0ABP0DNY0_9PEZI
MSLIDHSTPADRQQQEEEEREIHSETQTEIHEESWSDPDTASIATRDSEDLHTRRPNRWRGNPNAWRYVTEHDRAVATALWRTRDCDLSAHLYNAFFIKKQAQASGSSDTWRPGNFWTAWPLRPHDGLDVFDSPSYAENSAYGGVNDDSQWTYRSRPTPIEEKPSGPLEEMLTATIQRVARKQFSTMLQREDDGIDALSTVVSADDELSAHLLRPSVRHLLTQTDRTLSILHNSRGRGGLEPEGVRRVGWQLPRPSKKQAFARPSHWKRGPALMVATAQTPEQVAALIPKFDRPQEEADVLLPEAMLQARVQTFMSSGMRKPFVVKMPTNLPRGRPPKPRERLPGESENQFLLRVARQTHRRIPESAGSEDSQALREEQREAEVEAVDKDSKRKPPALVTYIPPPVLPSLQQRVTFANEVQTMPNWVNNVSGQEGDIVDDDDDDDDEEEEDDDEKEDDEHKGEDEGDHEAEYEKETHEESREEQLRRAQKKRRRSSASRTGPKGSTMAGWPLRTWKDVLGAAALSGGFSSEALARTAQRCADLFGQSTALATLYGVSEPADKTQLLGNRPQQQQDWKVKQPCTTVNVDFRPRPGPPCLPDVLTEPVSSSGLHKLTVEVKRAMDQRRDRQARKKRLLKQISGWNRPYDVIDREVESATDIFRIDNESVQVDGSEKADDRDEEDSLTPAVTVTPAVAHSRPVSSDIKWSASKRSPIRA